MSIIGLTVKSRALIERMSLLPDALLTLFFAFCEDLP